MDPKIVLHISVWDISEEDYADMTSYYPAQIRMVI